MSHLALNVLILSLSAVDWTFTPLLRCASISQSGAGRRQAVDPGRAGGEKHRVTHLHVAPPKTFYHFTDAELSHIKLLSVLL